jgi:hypothetical protein
MYGGDANQQFRYPAACVTNISDDCIGCDAKYDENWRIWQAILYTEQRLGSQSATSGHQHPHNQANYG